MHRDEIIKVSKQFLGISPKQEQLNVINSYMSGTDTLFIAPTGFGKSLVYQLAPFLHDRERYSPGTSSTPSTSSSSATNVHVDINNMSLCSFTSSISSTHSLSHLKHTQQHNASTPLRPGRSCNEDQVDSLSSFMSEMDISVTSTSNPKPLSHGTSKVE